MARESVRTSPDDNARPATTGSSSTKSASTPSSTGLAGSTSSADTTRGRTLPSGTASSMAEDADALRRRIAEAAYYRAQRRGFSPGGEEEDWLEAEKEVEGTGGDNLSGPATRQP